MSFGSSGFGSSVYGGSTGSFSVDQARALNAYTVEVTFSDDVDPGAATLNPANYSIPGLTITQVVLDPQPNRIRLITSVLSYVTYFLTVTSVQSVYGDNLSVLSPTVSFSGWAPDLGFTARAVSATAVQVLFAETMLFSAALTNAANYELTDLSGVSVPILSAVPNSVSNILRMRLNLSAPLTSSKPYALRLNDLIVTSNGRALNPKNANLVWHYSKPVVRVPMSLFTGEVRTVEQLDRTPTETLTLSETLGVSVEPAPDETDPVNDSLESTTYKWSLGEKAQIKQVEFIGGSANHDFIAEEKVTLTETLTALRPRSYVGVETLTLQESLRVLPEVTGGLDNATKALFGTPNGQVFFSPSLLPAVVAQSAISVDDVQVCTRAYDVYRPPAELDPPPLYTHGGGLVPTPASTLSPGFVLFARFDRLTGAKTNVSDQREEDVARFVDEGASIVLTQVYDPARFSLLSNPGWHLFDGTGLPFVVADNLAPVGPPVVGLGTYFANPAEDHSVVENLATAAGLHVSVSESMTLIEEEHRSPGVNNVLITASETLTLADAVLPTP